MTEIGQLIIQKVRDRAAADPDFRYEPPDGNSCVYVHEGCPSCLIGRGLWDAEVIGPELESDPTIVGSDFPVPVNKSGFPNLSRYLGLPLSEAEVEWLEIVQDSQDSGRSWADAVDDADSRVG